MDRQIVYASAIPLDTDTLKQNKNVMIALGMVMRAILGTSTLFDGLACSPTGPASMQVLVGPGSVYALENVDNTTYGSLAADTSDQIVKQGINLGTLTLSCPAPGTTGQSINYLIQGVYQDSDTGATVLPYYNSSNPAVAYNGPANLGTSQNTVRQGLCTVAVLAGVAATTGSQTTPAPTAGYTGLYVVTVANGQTTITSGNIAVYSGAPFISEKLTSKISIPTGDARYLMIGNIKTRLSSATTFYISTSGNDTTGTGTSGAPWATRNHAWNYVQQNYDINGYPVLFQFVNGIYTDVFAPSGWLTGQFYPSQVTFSGNSGSPSSVIFNPSSGDTFLASYCAYQTQYMELQNASNSGLNAAAYGNIIVGPGMIFGACSNAQVLTSAPSSLINLNNNYLIVGGGQSHWTTQASGASIIVGPSLTVTLTGTPVYSNAFAQASLGGEIFWQSPVPTFSGSATGTRYLVNSNAILATQGSYATIPGSTTTAPSTGGLVL